MNCPTCDQQIEGEDWDFCPSCGNSFSVPETGHPFITGPFSWLRYLLHLAIGGIILIPIGIYFYGTLGNPSLDVNNLPFLMTMYIVGGSFFCTTLAVYVQLPDYDENAKWEQLRDQLQGVYKNNKRSYVIQVLIVCIISAIVLFVSMLAMFVECMQLVG